MDNLQTLSMPQNELRWNSSEGESMEGKRIDVFVVIADVVVVAVDDSIRDDYCIIMCEWVTQATSKTIQ